jgi:ketosteroid isomerase-like protein
VVPAEHVRALYEAYQARDWEAAGACLHEEAVVDMPATAERLAGRAAVLDFQRSYPEPWGTLVVHRVYGDDTGAAAEVTVRAPDGPTVALGAFWRTRDGLLHYGVEYWVTPGGEDPPASRASSAATVAARAAWEASLPR